MKHEQHEGVLSEVERSSVAAILFRYRCRWLGGGTFISFRCMEKRLRRIVKPLLFRISCTNLHADFS
jgi:hypothetical protein